MQAMQTLNRLLGLQWGRFPNNLKGTLKKLNIDINIDSEECKDLIALRAEEFK